MRKDEFMKRLNDSLYSLGRDEREEIIYDYEEHFENGFADGLTEEEICYNLGNPDKIASSYTGHRNRYKVEPRGTVGGGIFATLALIFINLIFVLGPALGIIGVVFGFCIAAISISFSGLALTLGAFIPVAYSYITLPFQLSFITIFFTGIGLTALGLLFCIGMYFVVKYLIIGIKYYIDFNVKIIKGA